MDTQARFSPHRQRALVTSQARLHLGFLDMSGTSGRRFGSLGLTLDAFPTRVRVEPGSGLSAEGEDSTRALRFARTVATRLGMTGGMRVVVETAIPGHLGLGSGTQLALTVGHAMAAACGRELPSRELAALLQRGRRSGIGIGAFDRGGFLLDSGVGAAGAVPPVTARLPFPADWRVLLVMDARGQGLHGQQEREAFRQLPTFPRELSAHLCQLTLMQILPGIQEQQLAPVAAGISEIQRCVGDHFAFAQGGRFTSPAVADAIAWLEAQGVAGTGQSSWGPTGFALLPDAGTANDLLVAARQRFGELSPLRFRVVQACNRGSEITCESAMNIVEERG